MQSCLWFTVCLRLHLHDISTRVTEHLETDRASHIFKHLESLSACRSACSRDKYAIINQASLRFALKIRGVAHTLGQTNTSCTCQKC